MKNEGLEKQKIIFSLITLGEMMDDFCHPNEIWYQQKSIERGLSYGIPGGVIPGTLIACACQGWFTSQRHDERL